MFTKENLYLWKQTTENPARDSTALYGSERLRDNIARRVCQPSAGVFHGPGPPPRLDVRHRFTSLSLRPTGRRKAKAPSKRPTDAQLEWLDKRRRAGIEAAWFNQFQFKDRPAPVVDARASSFEVWFFGYFMRKAG
jgi:hypothetical protein